MLTPLLKPIAPGTEPIIEAFGGLDLDYINERYRIYDPVVGGLVEKPWADIVNSRSLPAGRTYWDSDGVLQTAAADAPVIEYDPVTEEKLGNRIWGSYTNHVQNSSFSGAVLGAQINGVSGWVLDAAGLSSEIVDIGQHRGLYYVDVRMTGTAITQFLVIRPNDVSAPVAGPVRFTSYSSFLSNAATLPLVFHVLRIGTTPTTQPMFLGDPFQRRSNSATVTAGQPCNARITATLQIGSTYDFVLRLSSLQLEFAATDSPYAATTGSAVTIPAESQIIDGSNFADLFNDGEGTFYIECSGAVNAVALKAAGLEVVVDSTSNKKYVLGYTSDPSATSLIIGANLNGYIRRIVIFRKDLPASVKARLVA